MQVSRQAWAPLPPSPPLPPAKNTAEVPTCAESAMGTPDGGLDNETEPEDNDPRLSRPADHLDNVEAALRQWDAAEGVGIESELCASLHPVTPCPLSSAEFFNSTATALLSSISASGLSCPDVNWVSLPVAERGLLNCSAPRAESLPMCIRAGRELAPFECSIHLVLSADRDESPVWRALRARYPDCRIRVWRTPRLEDGACWPLEPVFAATQQGPILRQNPRLEHVPLHPVVKGIRRLARALERNAEQVVALLHFDCDGCEWVGMAYLSSHDGALSRVLALFAVLNPRKLAPSEGASAVESLFRKLHKAGLPTKHVRAHHSVDSDEQIFSAFLAADVSPSRVLFSARAAAQRALQPWRSLGGITPEHVRGTRAFGKQYVELIHVVNRTVHVFAFGPRAFRFDFLRLRYLQIAKLVQRIADADLSFPDLEISFSIKDFPFAQIPGSNLSVTPPAYWAPDPLPALTMITCLDSYSLAFPSVSTCSGEGPWSTWEETYRRARAAAERVPWEQRVSKAIFRGGFSRTCNVGADGGGRGGTPSPTDTSECGRGLLFNMFRHENADVDVAGARLSLAEQERFKYVIYAHGHGQWASRLRLHLAGGRVLLKQLGVCDEFYATQLLPFVHYVPVDYNWRNLTEAVEWARKSDGEARKLVRNMNRYAHSAVGTLDRVAEYGRRLLRGYHELLVNKSFLFPVGMRLDDAVRSTTRHDVGCD